MLDRDRQLVTINLWSLPINVSNVICQCLHCLAIQAKKIRLEFMENVKRKATVIFITGLYRVWLWFSSTQFAFGRANGSLRAARGGRLPSRMHGISLCLGLLARQNTISHLSRLGCTQLQERGRGDEALATRALASHAKPGTIVPTKNFQLDLAVWRNPRKGMCGLIQNFFPCQACLR